MFSCIAIEPLHVVFGNDPACSTQSANEHCCFVCHSGQHQWIMQEAHSKPIAYDMQTGLLSLNQSIYPDPPISSIFHPPAFL